MIAVEEVTRLSQSIDIELPSGHALVVPLVRPDIAGFIIPSTAKQARRSDYYIIVCASFRNQEDEAMGLKGLLVPGAIIIATKYAGVSVEHQGNWYLKIEVSPREVGGVLHGASRAWVMENYSISTAEQGD